MSRIIMLIPIDQDVSLTTISLSMISFFHQHEYKNKLRQSILYFSCIDDLLDDTSKIIKKYFSRDVNILDNINFSKYYFLSDEYFMLLNQVIERCHNKKFLYEFILIEGMNYNHSHNSQEINYDISQNLSAEVILVANLKDNSLASFLEKEKKIKLFLKRLKYKNILGVIFNNVNSPFIEKKYNFIKKTSILNKMQITKKKLVTEKKEFKNILLPIIACIPWNRNIIRIDTINLYNFLKLRFLNSLKNKNLTVEKIIIFDTTNLNMLYEKYFNIVILASFTQINYLKNIFNWRLHRKKISGIILTDILQSEEDTVLMCRDLIDQGISVAFTEKNTVEILSQLLTFNFNLNVKDKTYIEELQKYITNFFSHNSILTLQNKNHYIIKYSPQEFFYYLKSLSKKIKKRIILPESYEPRILKAVSICQKYKIANCVLLGDSDKIYSIAHDQGISLSKNTEIINPNLIRNQYISRLVELRRKKGMDQNSAKKELEKDIVLATLILESNEVDGLVSGSIDTTANTIRPALQLIKTNVKNSLVSSIFFMLLPNQVLIYSDCAININPTAEELSEIAIQSADSSKIFRIEPRIAMLSYSTGDSGSGYEVEKVRRATDIVKRKRPDLIIDGPIQYDAAISKTVSKLKTPNSPLLGAATIFVFPDLNSGNIAYKAVQRSANLVSIGPILQGLRKPVNDLSRGASVEDIVYTIALTSIQSLQKNI